MLINVSDKSKQLLKQSNITTLLKTPVMTDAEYDEIKYIVEYIGGHWREKYKGFVFDDEVNIVKDKINYILGIKQFKLPDNVVFQIKNQFYPTPDWLAHDMVEYADIQKTDRVLEPSAGRGAILKYIASKTKYYYAVEYNKSNAKYLRDAGYRVNLTSFEKYSATINKQFDKIIMNPPFANKMDLIHTTLAYNILRQGGRPISLIAENSLYYDRPITHKFNAFLKSCGATVTEIPHGTFKESGTNVDVVMITINKVCNNKVNINS